MRKGNSNHAKDEILRDMYYTAGWQLDEINMLNGSGINYNIVKELLM